MFKGMNRGADHVALSFLFSMAGQELGVGMCFLGLVAWAWKLSMAMSGVGRTVRRCQSGRGVHTLRGRSL